MAPYIRSRLLTTLLTIWAAVTLAFFVLHIIPGNAVVSQMIQGGASPEQVAARQEAMGLDRHPLAQYVDYLTGLLRGDLGYSYVSQRPVSLLIADQLGATIALALSALLVAVVLGLLLGAASALYRARWIGWLANWASILSLSTPIYWTGTLAIFFFSSRLDLLPATGSGSLRHLLLPAAVLGFHVAGSLARVTASSLNQTLEADFVRTALAKGLPTRRIFYVHVLKASLPPVISLLALQMGFLLGGTVITEMIFARRGLGQLLHSAIFDQDYPVVLGIVILSAITYSLLNIAADVLHTLLDPRIRSGQEA